MTFDSLRFLLLITTFVFEKLNICLHLGHSTANLTLWNCCERAIGAVRANARECARASVHLSRYRSREHVVGRAVHARCVEAIGVGMHMFEFSARTCRGTIHFGPFNTHQIWSMGNNHSILTEYVFVSFSVYCRSLVGRDRLKSGTVGEIFAKDWSLEALKN